MRVDSVKWCAADDSRSSSRGVAETESGAAIGAASSPGSGGAIGDDAPRNGSKAGGDALSIGEGGAPEAATVGATVEDDAPISVRGGSVVGSIVTEPGVGSMEASCGSTVASDVPGERNVASIDARVPVPLCFGLPPRMRSEMVACGPGFGYS